LCNAINQSTRVLVSYLEDHRRSWWRLFQKRVVRTEFDSYDFIISYC